VRGYHLSSAHVHVCIYYQSINQSITGFMYIYGAINSLPVTATLQRRRVAMVNRRRVEKDHSILAAVSASQCCCRRRRRCCDNVQRLFQAVSTRYTAEYTGSAFSSSRCRLATTERGTGCREMSPQCTTTMHRDVVASS